MARRRRPRWFVVLVACVLALLVGSAAPVVLLRWVDPPTTAFMLRDRFLAWRADTPGYRFAQRWTEWDAISPHAKRAVVAAEDQKFPAHSGFDLESISDAIEQRRQGRTTRGASTISQQVAKNLFLWPGQSWLRKGIEAWFTVLIEAFWPKQRILEVYLNVAEFGPGTFGVGAAAERYFDKPAAQLNPWEAARLAAVLPNPKRMSATQPSTYVLERQRWIQQQMGRLGPIEALL
ncbi:MAG TPA: monofunctional biosynthetic peptidoglycan transglycosylase [Steroidobacteraceae bacterium]|nr:monofunctional biosynthetic peptidoglycan transglycosylase [Steroidobacteraceae bacterium]